MSDERPFHSIEEFIASLGGESIDVTGMSDQDIMNLYVRRKAAKAAIACGEDPNDPEVIARYTP